MTSKIFLKYKKQNGKLSGICTRFTWSCELIFFAELYNPWKDGCLAFTEEMIQVTKYYRESLDSRPVEKCKVRGEKDKLDYEWTCFINGWTQ